MDPDVNPDTATFFLTVKPLSVVSPSVKSGQIIAPWYHWEKHGLVLSLTRKTISCLGLSGFPESGTFSAKSREVLDKLEQIQVHTGSFRNHNFLTPQFSKVSEPFQITTLAIYEAPVTSHVFDINQWFSNLRVHQNHLEHLLKHRWLPHHHHHHHTKSDSVGCRNTYKAW